MQDVHTVHSLALDLNVHKSVIDRVVKTRAIRPDGVFDDRIRFWRPPAAAAIVAEVKRIRSIRRPAPSARPAGGDP
jgi:hypothetical protein